ncbi:hypothetical protein MUN78_07975 [Leucobacter allii]|uniref:Uncharacterized protein n=1 Tax=Leucobacter allii TaxID=2932247 RepID=A0ABY4FR38_9MICO|nr:hypothetical protein [Leucobacter allii]UOQ58746.1 hypothetical protein MUN78_07975 [Leucobacter allii]UOR03273.1 hypothetical protein MUN77_08325 [Leucobacter allii]
MITEFLRDQAFAIAWLALMAAGWFGWSQEDPRPKDRALLGAGSVLGFLLSCAFGILVWRNWGTASALEGQYWVFGVIVVAEAVVIGAGCIVLARRGQTRWYGWWIGLCVSLHFLPLAWVFGDWSYLALTAVQLTGLLAMRPALARSDFATSRWACAWIAATFLVYAIVSAAVFLARYGYPF